MAAAAAQAAAATAASQQAATIATQSQATLTAAANNIRGLITAQQAARAVAAAAQNAGMVANGLNTGGNGLLPGLVVDPRVTGANDSTNLWINANLPTQTTSNGQTTVTIQQTAPQAVLTWLYYNIGVNTTVVYNQQGNASWVALNRIDATGVPSQILGHIKADGTVLLINPNGIVFGGTSQININTLIASSLDIDGTTASSVFIGANGTGTPDYTQLMLNGVPLTTSNGTPVMVPPNESSSNVNFVANGLFTIAPGSGVSSNYGNSVAFAMGNQTLTGSNRGSIIVEPGASVTTAVDSLGNGGYVALLGSSVINSGSIVTQDGTIVLSAGNRAVLTEPSSTATGVNTAIALNAAINANTITFGSQLPVLQPSQGDGAVTNNGLLISYDGAVTIGAGAVFNQNGGIEATTSVSRIGSITLETPGAAIFGPASITAILPDANSGTVPAGSATGLDPVIKIEGDGGIDFQTGSLLRAPSAALTLTSLLGDVVLESDATVDVSGLANVGVPVTSYLVTFKVTQNDIANSPLAASLIGQTVTIDTRIGSPLIDVSAYAALIPESIDEVLTAGGSVTVNGNFIQRTGSLTNISGGYVTFTGGTINTTKLLGSDGRIYDIGSAPADISYVGLAGEFTADHAHWGVTQTYTNPLLVEGYYDPTYIAGASAGSLSFTSGLPALEGTIFADTVTGRRQRANAIGGGTTAQASLENLPKGASFSLSAQFGGSYLLETSAQAGSDPYGLSAYVFGGTWTPPSTFPILTDKLSETGFASISITGPSGYNPTVNMTAGSVLTVAPGGKVTLTGVETIGGTINAPSGTISLTGYTYDSTDLSGVQNLAPLTLAPGAVLNVAGLWINDTGAVGDAVQGNAFINGGSVSISTIAASYRAGSSDSDNIDVTQSIYLAPGSVINLSSGGYIGTNGKQALGSDGLPLGKGGSLSLVTYTGGWILYNYDATHNGTQLYNQAPSGGNEPNAATVIMDGTIYAEGFDTGGTFTLQAPTITIDGTATSVTSYTSGPNSGTIVLPTSFFTDNGFSNYGLTSTYGSTTVTTGTQLLLQQSNYLSGVGGGTVLSNLTMLGAAGAGSVNPADVLGLTLQPTGAEVQNFVQIGLAPDGLRNPVSLTLNEVPYILDPTGQAPPAGVLIGQGAAIIAEANASKPASITLSSTGGPVTVLGSIIAPGGSISLSTATSTNNNGLTASDVWIGANAVLDVSGIYVPNPTVAYYQTGRVIDAGTISLSGEAIVALPGSELRLDGTSAQIEMPSGSANLTQRFVTQEIWSDGGALTLTGAPYGIYFAGGVSAAGGAPLASGGTFSVLNQGGSIVVEPAGVVAAALATAEAGSYPLTPGALADALPTSNGAAYGNVAFIGTDTLNQSGFESVTLNAGPGAIAFNGSASITVPGSLILIGTPTLMQASTTLLPAGVTNPIACTGSNCVPNGTTVDLTAGYVWLSSTASGMSPSAADTTLNVTAQWIDIGSPTSSVVSLQNVGSATFTSSEAIRLIGGTNDTTGNSFYGGLFAAGDLTLNAAEIYPTSGTTFVLMSTGTANSLTINQIGAASQPLSAGGTLILDAANINQNGTVWAPFGQVVVGLTSSTVASLEAANSPLSTLLAPYVATQNVTLGAGSLTSVSGNGSLVPYGYTVDGATWYVGDTAYASAAYQGVTLTGATSAANSTTGLTKAITLAGASVTTDKGAVLDLSGGGDIYATEFVSGTGGTVNVLAGNTVYALVPTSTAKVAPYDPTFANAYGSSLLNGVAGESITIAGGNGIPAGTYVLMPGMYATLPGAYRVTVAPSSVKTAATQSYTTDDGSLFVTGTFSNAITGARSSQTVLFELQSDVVWTKYSQINITSGTSFLSHLATTAGTGVPTLPIDGGILIFAATSSLTTNGTNYFQIGTSSLAPNIQGLSGQVDISANNILMLASDKTTPIQDAGYLVLNADQISNLGATTAIIGGSSTIDGSGNLALTALATNLEVDTDAAHPLSAPQLILLSQAGGNGITVDNGSVISAVGSVPATSNRNMTVSGDGSLLRVSNGTMVSLTRSGTLSGTGNLSIGNNVTINGGGALTLDTSGTGSLGANVTLTANAFDLSASVINIGGGTSGFVLDAAMVANFAGASSVLLQSASVINFYDTSTPDGLSIGDASNPIGTLTFDAAGLYSAGGTTTIDATNVVFTDSQATPNIANVQPGATATGTLYINAGGTLAWSATPAATSADTYGFTLGNFSQVDAIAGQAIVFSGSGNFSAGAASVTLSAPNIIAAAGSSQSFTTSGDLTIYQNGAAGAVASTNIGGSLSLSGGSIADYGTITALSGTLSLIATGAASSSDPTVGSVTLYAGAVINAGGSEIVLGPVIEDAPAGTVELFASGNVTLFSGSTIDVSAAGAGYAGAIAIMAPNGQVTLEGTLTGSPAYNDLGGRFLLIADTLKPGDALPYVNGFTSSFEVELGRGDITVAAGQTLTSGNVLLVANNGNIDIEGTIDASGPSGGAIALYGSGTTTNAAGTVGASGVTIGSTAKLLARYQADDPSDPAYANGTSTLVETGGTITLGTTGTPDGTVNQTYGYENVPGSGAITVAAGAIFDVSGGAGGANINNTGGSIIVRAPILTNNNINVSFKGTLVTNAGSNGNPSGQGVVADAFAVWSTTDPTTNLNTHFDGIIDPAGFFDAAGTQIISADANGFYPSSSATDPAAGAYLPHIVFYQTTLVDFVNNPFDATAVAGDFAGARIQTSPSTVTTALPSSSLQLRPEIDLVNPSTSINRGNITVDSNWNLGAGTENSSGAVQLYYRTASGEPGVLALRAINNININATISDGFFLQYLGTPLPSILPPSTTTTTEIPDATYYYNLELAQLGNYNSFIDSSGNLTFNGLTLDQMFGSGTYIPLNLLGPVTLQAPANFQNPTNDPTVANLIDQYNQYYYQYTQLFDVYQRETAWDEGFYTPPSGSAVYQPPAAPISPINYYNFLTGPQPGISGPLGSDYVSQYENYLINTVVNVNGGSYDGSNFASVVSSDSCFSCVAYAAPFAPLAQLASALQPGYTPSAPVTITVSLPTRLSGPVTADMIATLYAPAVNAIANNAPALVNLDQLYDVSSLYNPTSATPLMTSAISGKGSFSYNFVGGAYFPLNGTSSVNPDAVVSLSGAVSATSPTDSITISGHTAYTDPLNTSETVYVPTLVRTGTGSIRLAAAGDVLFTDPTVQGAVYTAGTAATTPSDFTAPTLSASYQAMPNGLVSTPQWGTGGGSITVDVGQSIIGIGVTTTTGAAGDTVTTESVADWYDHSGQSNGSATPFGGCSSGSTCQTAAWVNYATFFQNFGALGGGTITLKAGRDVTDISAVLPETLVVAGGTASADPAHILYYGGGNLLVQAGGNLNSSSFLVGLGSGLIEVAGAVQATSVNPITGQAESANGLQLYVQDGFINLMASGSVNVASVRDPAEVSVNSPGYSSYYLTLTPEGDQASVAGFGSAFTSYGPQAGVSLTSLSGDVMFAAGSKFASFLPPSLSVAAVQGNITISGTATLFAYPVDAVGDDTGALTLAAAGSIFTESLTLGAPQINIVGSVSGVATATYYRNPLGSTSFSYAPADLATSAPAVVYAGQDISGTLNVNRPAYIQAGRDIGPGNAFFQFTGLNLTNDDVTSIIAGQDIGVIYNGVGNGTNFTLYGPGALLIEAGRDIGIAGFGGSGIVAAGNGSANGGAFIPFLPGQSYIPYLPARSADIYVLYGTKAGVDYANFINGYVNPANLAANGFSGPFLTIINGVSVDLATAAGWALFQQLPAAQQDLIADHQFLTLLAAVAADYNNAASPYYQQSARAYAAIDALFPASYGYGANVTTGNLTMSQALIETQQGGNINILAPGGGLTAGTAGRDSLGASQEGILTLQGGTISIFTEQTVLVNQSRIMTEEGGDIDIFSAYGNISAGSGPKTYYSNPVLSEICDAGGYCFINPAGLVTGAGIAAVLSLPGQDPSLSNVSLTAPHGYIDIGAAGVRGTDVNLVTPVVLNSYNISAQGTTQGLQTQATPNVAALTSANAAAGASQAGTQPPQKQNNAPAEAPSLISVEVLGYGGGNSDAVAPINELNAPDSQIDVRRRAP